MLFRKSAFAAIMALTCMFCANDAFAQRGGWGGGNDSKLQYLFDESVQKELEILDAQSEQIQKIGDEARNVMRDAFSGMRSNFRDMSREERNEMMGKIRVKIEEDMKVVEQKVDTVLVPHQLERLDQIVLQGRMRRSGTAAALKNDSVREKLGLTDEDAEALIKKEEEVKAELEEQIKKLRAEAQDKILSVLSAEKQEKIKLMMGDSFETQRGGRGGDRGGRGGDRGGRGGDRGDRGGERRDRG